MKYSKNVLTVLEILRNEVDGDSRAALKKMTRDYTMTWVYQTKKQLFPSVHVDGTEDLDDVYPITGRTYHIKNIAEGKNVVMVELIESYPDPKTKKVYRTPLVLVLEFKGGKIRTGRHYCDPLLSYLHLTSQQIARAFKNGGADKLIIK